MPPVDGAAATASQSPPAERSSSTLLRWNQAIDTAARNGDCKKAGSLLMECQQQAGEQAQSPDTVSYNLVIRAFAKKGDYKGAEEWFYRMEASGLEATICSYNTLLDACAQANNAEGCDSWLGRMLSKGCEANVISYATAIYAWAR